MKLLDGLTAGARGASRAATWGMETAAASVGGVAGFVMGLARSAPGKAQSPATPDEATAAYLQAAADAQQEIGRINVLIAGNTGVGKSTLVNAIFGDAVAPVAAGAPVTQMLTVYEAPNAPLNLWDSRGFEAGDSDAVRRVDAKLAELRAQADPAAQIHVAWLCINTMSNRIEPVHQRFLQQMADRAIPTIVVFTQSYRPMPADAKALATPAAAQIDVVAEAETGLGRSASGLTELVEATDRLLPEARKAAFAAAQKVQWTLKKTEARRVVAKAAALAGGSAIVPGHSLILTGMQVVMLAKIDTIYGRRLLSADLSAVKSVLTASASSGGKWALGLLLSEELKLSGIGYAAGVALGGAVGASITAAMGYAYVEAVSRYTEAGLDLPLAEVVQMVATAVNNSRA